MEKKSKWLRVVVVAVVVVVVVIVKIGGVAGVGSMGSLAAAYGENGPALCGLSADGLQQVYCFGGDQASVSAAPLRRAFAGLTAGDGFVCGLEVASRQPYCWGNNLYVEMGEPRAVEENLTYVEISAGDNHLCALRRGRRAVDCWGYNMTGTVRFGGAQVESITAGSMFNCLTFKANRTVFCWGDETGSGVISGAPRGLPFRAVSAGGYHVCGIGEGRRAVCWGRTELWSRAEPPPVALSSIVGGKFHACGIVAPGRRALCWGQRLPNMSPAPADSEFLAVAAGDYFTCGVGAKALQTVCWGLGFPKMSPLAVAPGVCKTSPCDPGTYQLGFSDEKTLCERPAQVCVPCSEGCPAGMYQSAPCSPASDRRCSYNCSQCAAEGECNAACRGGSESSKHRRRPPVQTPIIIAEMATAVVVAGVLSAVAFVWVRFRLTRAPPAATVTIKTPPSKKGGCSTTSLQHEMKMRRAQVFRYEELERATGGFNKDSEVGRGSYSVVFKGVLADGRAVAVKRATVETPDLADGDEFHREVDLLSRLNHAHLLNLLGYCEEKGERLLVYEFMSHGTLHEHLHGKSKPRLGWVRRVTIAVQAARGLEYLHGYACPPVIHRDIKSSNILIDQDHNARVSDFGLSLLGPADSSAPLSELPAGTLGYLDPEYYRLHYLTTKSDVYSFGVLLLEILSGRKAIDMQYEEGGNIVEWAVPLIKGGKISDILDPGLEPPLNFEALYRIAKVAYKCVKMQGKKRPSMDRVTTELERALALLMGTPCDEQPILPTEVVLGSSRLHKNKSSGGSTELEVRAPSWITFPSVASSQRRKSSVSDDKNDEEQQQQQQQQRVGSLRCLNEEQIYMPEIAPASPEQELYLQNNF